MTVGPYLQGIEAVKAILYGHDELKLSVLFCQKHINAKGPIGVLALIYSWFCASIM